MIDTLSHNPHNNRTKRTQLHPFAYAMAGEVVSEDKYNGALENGMAHGGGELKYADGRVYVGVFVEGKRNDKGLMKYVSGDVFDGEWKDDCKHGRGTYTFSNGLELEYVGEFKDGIRNGNGIARFADGSEYMGEWENDFMHGEGTYKWTTGLEYVGEFKDGKHNGTGIMRTAIGDVYEGKWENDAANGKGIMRYANGEVYDGEYINGKKNGEGTLRDANGDMFKRIYIDNELVSSKRCVSSPWDVTTNHDSLSSPRSSADGTVDVIVLNEYDTECQLCNNKFLTDMNTENQKAKLRLPVIGTCHHICCYGCLKRMTLTNRNGINCMECRKEDAFCSSEPQFHRRLIDWLKRSNPTLRSTNS